jgi:hypothetical protein
MFKYWPGELTAIVLNLNAIILLCGSIWPNILIERIIVDNLGVRYGMALFKVLLSIPLSSTAFQP